jgi:hypothetical protein
VVYRGLGLIGPVDDYGDVDAALLMLGEVAIYDYGTIYVREGGVTPYLRESLVRETTNALDDQLFGFDRPDLSLDFDAQLAYDALIEGDAARAGRIYRESLTNEERRQIEESEAARERLIDLAEVPLPFRNRWTAPERHGEQFVDGLFDHDGNLAIDAAFRSPPNTSEQIIYVDSYFGREPNRDIHHPVPDPEGELIASGPVGQFTIAAMLRTVLDQPGAERAADGWAGDWFVAWQEGTSSCSRSTLVMETLDDTRELKVAFDAWGLEQYGRYYIFSEEDRVVVTNCVG